MGFICNQHRQQVLSSPPTAISYWNQWMDQASQYLLERDWREATRYIGCSFEASYWLLGQPELIGDKSGPDYLDRFLAAGHQLAECLGEQDQPSLQLHYLLAVHIELMSRARAGSHKHWQIGLCLRQSLEKLGCYCQRNGNFKGYEDCCCETRFYIDKDLH